MLRTTLAGAPLAAFVIDWEGQVRSGWNDRAAELFECEAHEALGQNVHDLCAPRTRTGAPADLTPSKDGSRSGPTPLQMRAASGRTFTATATVAPFRNHLGQVAGGVVFIEDRSQQSTLEAQLRQAQKLEAVGQLAGGIAHDFNNLLTIVQTNTELLQDQLNALGAGEAAAEHLSDIGDAVARGSELVRRLMAFGRKEPERVRVLDLGELISGYAKTIQRVLPDDVKVEVAVGPRVPPVRVDPGAVQQIVLNLVTNARDAMTGGGSLRLTVTSAPPEASKPGVLLSVADTGKGIEPDHLEHVFEPFFTTKDADRGTGLGLSMVRELVRQMDGSVEVTSELGKGTEFVLHFPAAQGASEPSAGIEATPPGRRRGSAAATVLVVEDDASVRKVIRRALASAGYEVIVTADGEQALEAFNRHPEAVDLVVSDLIMPNMDGASLHSALQSRDGPPVPFLFISGYGDRDPRVEELLSRGVPVLHKPWSVAALCEAVQDALLVSPDSKEVDSGSLSSP